MAEAVTLRCCTCVKWWACSRAAFWVVTALLWAWPLGADGQQLTAAESPRDFHKTEASNSKLTLTCPKGTMCKYKLQTTGMEESYASLLQALRMNPTRKERRKTHTKLLWEPETPSTGASPRFWRTLRILDNSPLSGLNQAIHTKGSGEFKPLQSRLEEYLKHVSSPRSHALQRSNISALQRSAAGQGYSYSSRKIKQNEEKG